MSEFLSLLDVCERYEISKHTLYQWTAKGFIPHLKLGGLLRFREQDLRRWEERNLSGERDTDLV